MKSFHIFSPDSLLEKKSSVCSTHCAGSMSGTNHLICLDSHLRASKNWDVVSENDERASFSVLFSVLKILDFIPICSI